MAHPPSSLSGSGASQGVSSPLWLGSALHFWMLERGPRAAPPLEHLGRPEGGRGHTVLESKHRGLITCTDIFF